MNILITSKSHFQSLRGRLTSVNNKSANPSCVSQLWSTQQNLKPIIAPQPLAWSQYNINIKNHSVLEQYFTPGCWLKGQVCLNNISDKWFSSLISIYPSPAFIGDEEILITRNREREAGQGSIKQENCILQSLSNTLQTSNLWSHSSCMKWFQSFLSFSWSINQRSLIQNGNIVIKRNRERERITRVGKLNFGISLKHCSNPCSHISCK